MSAKLALAAALIVGLTTPHFADAHPMKALEDDLFQKEKYFQPLDKPAPDFDLVNENGEPVRLADLRGQVVVLHFIYTHCPDVCPLHAERIAEIQEMVNQTPMRDAVRFVTITTDPKRDDGAVRREYGEVHGLDPANWTFLSSGPERLTATRELVEKFGHKFTEVEDGYQVHSVVTHIIDQSGRWRANFHGLKFEPTNLVIFINALVNDPHDADAPAPSGLLDKLKALF